MANARAILKRRKAVQNIHKITRTMQLIATARFQKAFNRTVSSKPYTEKITHLVSNLSHYGEVRHPLLVVPETVEKIDLLIITSNRGLCGGYNSNILHTAHRFIDERQKAGQSVSIDVVGKKGISHLKFLGMNVEQTYLLPDVAPYRKVEQIAGRYIERFGSGQTQAVAVAYMQFISTSKQRPTVMQLLPMEIDESEQIYKPGEAPEHYAYEFLPSPAEIMDELIPEAVRVALYQCFMDASVSEEVARMVSMKAATDNSEEMIKHLTRQANKARQSQITAELSELISGAEALK